MKKRELHPLNALHPGEAGKIAEILGSHDSLQRLFNVGLFPGCKIHLLVSNSGHYMLAVDENRVAIGEEVARNILVEVQETEDALTEAIKRLKSVWTKEMETEVPSTT